MEVEERFVVARMIRIHVVKYPVWREIGSERVDFNRMHRMH